ncbi:unnamed protein product [Nesidiocoris tenuis]|uniref:Enhancer of rudimentary homolog n=1 Tax=Nesidiocoris tenuis TaxID=355587 RepID=A0A6H5GAD8_9HEMI|nr:unnamed protein product [Nesidiocoris tenuis]
MSIHKKYVGSFFFSPSNFEFFSLSVQEFKLIVSFTDVSIEILQAHTIMLIQPGPKPETRTYSDYESVNECMEGVCRIYEEHLKRQNPNTPAITYDVSQLFDFIDQLSDLSCLVYQKGTNTYAPYNKDWIKEKIYVLLRRQANGPV